MPAVRPTFLVEWTHCRDTTFRYVVFEREALEYLSLFSFTYSYDSLVSLTQHPCHSTYLSLAIIQLDLEHRYLCTYIQNSHPAYRGSSFGSIFIEMYFVFTSFWRQSVLRVRIHAPRLRYSRNRDSMFMIVSLRVAEFRKLALDMHSFLSAGSIALYVVFERLCWARSARISRLVTHFQRHYVVRKWTTITHSSSLIAYSLSIYSVRARSARISYLSLLHHYVVRSTRTTITLFIAYSLLTLNIAEVIHTCHSLQTHYGRSTRTTITHSSSLIAYSLSIYIKWRILEQQ